MSKMSSENVSSEDAVVYGEDNYEHVTPGLVYIDKSCFGPGIDGELLDCCLKGCECRTSTCGEGSCECLNRSGVTSLSRVGGFIHRSYPVFECHSECDCESTCPNRVTGNGPRRGLKVVRVGTKGFGVITEADIDEGSFVCEYAGEVIGKEEAARRLKFQAPEDSNFIFVLREYSGRNTDPQMTIVDPTILGNIGRYINHSCEPNLRVVPVRSQSLVPMVALFAVKAIRTGEELCYDYNETSSARPDEKVTAESVFHSSKPCLCSSINCRKFLPSNQSLF